MKNQRSHRLKINFLIVTFVIATYFWPGLLLYPVGYLLSRDDHPTKSADFVVVLMGQVDIRPVVAARAVLDGYAENLVFVSSESNSLESMNLVPPEADLTKAVVTKAGLDLSRVQVIDSFGRASSTVEEALILNKYFSSLPKRPHRIVVVTSWPHSSRAGWILEKALSPMGVDVNIMPVEKVPFAIGDWWRSEYGLLFVFEEYVKWARYLMMYGGRNII